MTFTAKDTKALSKKPHKKDQEELALIIMHHHDWCEKNMESQLTPSWARWQIIKKKKKKSVKKATENLNPKRGMNQPNSNKNWKSDPKSILQCFIKWKQQVRRFRPSQSAYKYKTIDNS